MKKTIILAAYILLFWIVLPGIILLSAAWIDRHFAFTLTPKLLPGILLLGVALPLLAISIIQFRKFSGKYPVSADPPELFIRTGLYAVWRHPIYLFYTLTLIGIALLWGSRGMLYVSIPAFVVLEVVYIIIEENMLVRRFGNRYLNYRKKTPVLIPRFYFWLKIPFFLLFRTKFAYRASGRENIPDSPPFFLVSAHRNYLDPFYLAQAFPYPIRYITTFEMYRNAKIRWFFKALDCIPKRRYLNDVSTGREILRAIRQDEVIGIFPEGERGWTGVVKSLKPETLNLFRKLNHIPILPVRLKGNFFAWPRWAKGARRSHVKVEFLEPIRVGREWDRKQIEERLLAAINPDDLDHPDFFCSSKRRIEELSKVIYRCPLCSSFEGLFLAGNKGKCSICGATIEMDERYYLRCRNREKNLEGSLDEVYQTIRIRSDKLQGLAKQEVPAELEAVCRDDEQIIAFCQEVELSAESFNRMEHLLTGNMALTGQRLIFTESSDTFSIRLRGISSLTTESNYKLQLYDHPEEKLYQLVFGGESVLKWQDLIAACIEKEFAHIPNLR